MDIVTVVISGIDHLGISLKDRRLTGKFLAEEVECAFQWAVKQPAHKAKSKEIAAFDDRLVVKSAVGKRGLGHGGDGHIEHLGTDSELTDRIVGCIERFLEIGLLERVDINDDHAAFLYVVDVLFECRGIHCHENITFVTRSVDIRSYAHLKARHTAKRTLRSADLGRIVRERGDLVAQACGDICKDIAHELHAVAGVAGEADHNLFEGLHACFC